MSERIVVVVSDCHLSAGKFFEGRLNPHEDFFFDDEMCDLIEHFSTGEYSTDESGPKDVEFFVNGDFYDFLNVPIHGEFEEVITEDVAVQKIDAILAAHPKVSEAIRKFASLSGKHVTYMIGNHDADLFFPKVRERITRAWDPQGKYPSEKVQIVADRDHITYPEGVQIHHGNQFEYVHILNFNRPLLTDFLKTPVLNIPWGSFYVLKILNRLRWERDYIDKIRPIKVFLIFGLLFDFFFTLKFMFLSSMYFLRTRFIYSPKRRSSLKVTLGILKEETGNLWQDLEAPARAILDKHKEIKTVIFGHTHHPMNRVYPDGKQYINTGTWTKMINLDFRRLGPQLKLTFALVKLKDGKSECELRQWVGEHGPHQTFHG